MKHNGDSMNRTRAHEMRKEGRSYFERETSYLDVVLTLIVMQCRGLILKRYCTLSYSLTSWMTYVDELTYHEAL